MAEILINNIRIAGLSACVPKRIEKNIDYSYLSKEEIEKYICSTGIKERHCAIHDGSICTSDLCQEAAEKLIADLNWEKDSIELLVFVSHTADYKLPSTACILQYRLGLSKSCIAFDVPLGCSGYVYGLSIVGSFMQTGQVKRALLLVGNTQSFYASPKDQSTALLFGDAGTATCLEYCKESESITIDLGTDGSGKDFLIVPDGGCRNPFSEKSLIEEKTHDGKIKNRLTECMDGTEVFMFATRKIPLSLNSVMESVGIGVEGIDFLLLHQANKMICEKIRKKLKFPEEKTPYNIDRFGNTSGATIPLLMVTELREELQTRKLTMLAAGFGVGLSWGSVLFSTDKIKCPELIQI